MRSRYVIGWHPEHPLRGKRGEVFEHRVVLYDHIGPGPHPCHWCGSPVDWRVRAQWASFRGDELVVDHLDGNPQNNDPANLVPSCFTCNTRRGPNIIREGEPYLVRSNGNRIRADKTTCQTCGAHFLYAPQLTDGKYCSRACSNKGKERAICGNGHPMEGDNIYVWNGRRSCAACRKASAKRQDAKRKAERHARKNA